jgi:hypothetical protein
MTSIVRNGELIPEAATTVIVDVDLDAEIPCEEIGECPNPAVWRTGRLACGHGGKLVCNEFYEHRVAYRALRVSCAICGHTEPYSPWLAKWVRI